MTSAKSLLTPFAALAPLALMATPLQAQASERPAPTASIDISDLDLATERGASKLQARIATLIRRMCAPSDRSLEAKKLERSCRAAAFNDAEPQVRLAIQEARSQTIRLAFAKPVATQK